MGGGDLIVTNARATKATGKQGAGWAVYLQVGAGTGGLLFFVRWHKTYICACDLNLYSALIQACSVSFFDCCACCVACLLAFASAAAIIKALWAPLYHRLSLLCLAPQTKAAIKRRRSQQFWAEVAFFRGAPALSSQRNFFAAPGSIWTLTFP